LKKQEEVMTTCPLCGFENLDGADVCEQCESSLSEFSTPRAHTREERHILKDRVFLLSPRRAITVSVDTKVGDVLQTLVKQNVGCVVVMEGDEVAGIFTERDALMRINVDAEELADQPIFDYMTPNPQTLEINDRIAFALQKMDVGGYRHIPILTDGRLTGVISLRDILKYISEHLLTIPV
jgi:CBS domain-containing protein